MMPRFFSSSRGVRLLLLLPLFFFGGDVGHHAPVSLLSSAAEHPTGQVVEVEARLESELPAWEADAFDGGELEFACPNTFSVEVSSFLPTYRGISYGGDHLYQLAQGEGPHPAWVEGAEHDGLGERITFKVQALRADYEPWGISGEFRLINGYAKNERIWRANGRVQQFEVRRNGRLIARVKLLDRPSVQSIWLGELFQDNPLVLGDELEFRISQVYPGSKYRDTALTYFASCCWP